MSLSAGAHSPGSAARLPSLFGFFRVPRAVLQPHSSAVLGIILSGRRGQGEATDHISFAPRRRDQPGLVNGSGDRRGNVVNCEADRVRKSAVGTSPAKHVWTKHVGTEHVGTKDVGTKDVGT
jgi:hypothetical protein